MNCSSLKRLDGEMQSTRLHRADTCARSSRQLPARFRPRTMTDSPALHPLHSISLQLHKFHFRFISFRRPQTGETVRNKSCAPEKAKRPRDSVRPAAIARDAPHGQDTAIWPRDSVRPRQAIVREAPPGQDMAITVRSAISAPPPFRKLHCSGQKQPNSLVKTDWSDTTAAGCGQVCRARPCCHRVADHALRSAVAESENLAGAGATAPENESSRTG
jgi:hypothetical protein